MGNAFLGPEDLQKQAMVSRVLAKFVVDKVEAATNQGDRGCTDAFEFRSLLQQEEQLKERGGRTVEGAIVSHLPTLLQTDKRFNDRLARLPQKYRSAILAAEIGSSMVYRGGRDSDFEDTVRLFVERTFPKA